MGNFLEKMEDIELKGLKTVIGKHKIFTGILVLAVVLVLVIFLVLTRFRTKDLPQTGQTKVSTMELKKMDLANSVGATGTVESAEVHTVSANVSNLKVKSVKAEEGDEVKKGQTLLVFEKEDLKEALEEAEDNLSSTQEQASREEEQAENQLENAEDIYESQKKTMAQSVKNVKENYQLAKDSVKELKKQAAAAKEPEKSQIEEQLSQAQNSVSQAKASYEQAVNERKNTNKQNLQNIESAENALETTKSNNKKSIKQAQKSVDQAEEALQNATVKAPAAGTITGIGVSEGDMYAGGTLFEISDCENLQVTTTVSEYDIMSVEKGQKAVILTDATGDEELEGEITYVAKTTASTSMSSGNGADMTSSSSGGYAVRIKLKDTDGKILVGMTAKCSILLEEAADVFAVPYDAVHTNADDESVIYVLSNGMNHTDAAGNTQDVSGNPEDGEKEESGMSEEFSGERPERDFSEKRASKSQGTENAGENAAADALQEKREIVVTVGMESDYYVEISGDDLTEGLLVVIPSDASGTASSEDKEKSDEAAAFGAMNNMGGRGGMGGQTSSGGMSGGRPGM